MFSSQLEKRTSVVLWVVAVTVQILKPSLELVVLLKHELQRFTDDVGLRRIDELGVLCESRSDVLVDSDLQGFILWCFRR